MGRHPFHCRPRRLGWWRPVFMAMLLLASGMALGERLQSAAFSIEYQPGDEAVAQRSLEVLEAARAEFAPQLPWQGPPVRVLVAGSPALFRQQAQRFSGMEISGLARPAEGIIVVKAPYVEGPAHDYAGTLRHELIHVLLHRALGGDRLPRWLNEGIAMMGANEYQWAAPLTVGKMYLSRAIIPYHELDYAFLAPGTEAEFGHAYAQALSMTRYLFDTLGRDRFWALVRACKAQSFHDALLAQSGQEVLAFWDAYLGSLWIAALVAATGSGSFFLPMPFLLILAYFRKWQRNRAILAAWEEEEPDEEDRPLTWDEAVDRSNWDDERPE